MLLFLRALVMISYTFVFWAAYSISVTLMTELVTLLKPFVMAADQLTCCYQQFTQQLWACDYLRPEMADRHSCYCV